MKIYLICLLLLAGLPAGTNAAAPALIVILLPGTSLSDWQKADAPNLHRLMHTGALAVMNTRTAHQAGQTGQEQPQAALLTLGAGSRAAGDEASQGFSPAESQVLGMGISSAALFERRTGLAPRSDQSVCRDWPLLLRSNRIPGYDLHLGNLADTLIEHGIRMAAGGGDEADWVATSSLGILSRVAELKSVPGQCLIWDAGPNVTTADAAIGVAAEQQSRLIVLSPYANNRDYKQNERLTPILIWGSGVAPGLLSSASTRRHGLVTNTDFAPSIAEYFGIKRTEFRTLPFGFAWSALASPNNSTDTERLNRQSVQQARGMQILPYLAVTLAFWILAVTLLTRRCQIEFFWEVAPLASLIAALFAVSAASFWMILPGTLALILLLTCFVQKQTVLTILACTTAGALIFDMVSGNRLMHGGLLGYSAIEGARYYGIGNEAMGLLLGSALAAAALMWSPSKRRQFFLLSLLIGIVVLLGSAGAKAGGVLVSLAVFGTFAYTVTGRRWTARTAIVLGTIVTAGMAAAALTDTFLFPAQHSHIGDAVERILFGGSGEALDIVRRKLAVEGRLAYHSAWAALLWTGLGCWRLLWEHQPAITKTTIALRLAGGTGIAACLLLNDAGVVAAAIFVVILWSSAVIPRKNLAASDFSKTARRVS
ncbi:MAG: hypothetical protein ACRYFS_25130 [Janthinobacterium lividum]